MPEASVAYDLLSVTARIVKSFVGHNTVRSTELPELVAGVHLSLLQASKSVPAEPAVAVPAVSVKRSITLDYLICLEDGRKLKTLKRHLQKVYGLSPDQYRTKWGLVPDYPMVAPGYSVRRAELAKASAFGNYRKRSKAASTEEPGPGSAQTAGKRRRRALPEAA